MPADFDWQTDAADEVLPQITRIPPKNKRWPRILVLVALLVTAITIVVMQVRSRIDETVAQTELDVRATHDLMLDSARKADADVFTSILSGRDPQWSSAMRDLISGGNYFDLEPFKLYYIEEDPPEIEVDLSTDLASATVTTVYRYRRNPGLGDGDILALKRSDIYRRGAGRWLLAPPEPSFWGERRTDRQFYFNLHYDERDLAVAKGVFRLLDQKLSELCLMLTENECQFNPVIDVVLTHNPDSWIDQKDDFSGANGSAEILLPSPSLIGIPVSQEDFHVIEKAYVAYVISRIVPELIGWRCCQQAGLYQALLDRLLVDLELIQWPMNSTDYEIILNNLVGIYDLTWTRRSAPEEHEWEWQLDHAIVAFLADQDLGITVADMLVHLPGSRSYEQWIRGFASVNGVQTALNNEWPRYIYDRSHSASVTSPLDMPDEKLMVLCGSQTDNNPDALFLYDLTTDSWTPVGGNHDIDFMISIRPTGSVLMQGRNEDGVPATFIYQEGDLKTIYEATSQTGRGYVFLGVTDPTGTKAVMQNIRWDVRANNDGSSNAYGILPVDQCLAGTCDLIELPGWPYWSPDGKRTIIEKENEYRFAYPYHGTILLGDEWGRGLSEIGNGTGAFWLSNVRFGFVPQTPAREFFLVSGDNRQTDVVVTAEELRSLIPVEERPSVILIGALYPLPDNSRSKVVILTYNPDPSRNNPIFFLYDTRGGTVEYLAGFDQMGLFRPAFSPDGEWMSLRLTGDREQPGSDSWFLHLFNLKTKRSLAPLRESPEGLSLPSWSTSGNWLIRTSANVLDLIAPDFEVDDGLPYHHLIDHNLGACRQAVWIGG